MNTILKKIPSFILTVLAIIFATSLMLYTMIVDVLVENGFAPTYVALDGFKVTILSLGFLTSSYLYIRKKRLIHQEEMSRCEEKLKKEMWGFAAEKALFNIATSNLSDVVSLFIKPPKDKEAQKILVHSRFVAIKKVLESYRENYPHENPLPHRLSLLIEEQTGTSLE